MLRFLVAGLVVSILLPLAGGRQALAARAPEQQPQSALAEYIDLFIGLARQALDDARLEAAMPCLPHWVAGSDHIVVAVSDSGAAAGLQPGDTLYEIEGIPLTQDAGGLWDEAMRRLPRNLTSFVVAVSRSGTVRRLRLPCAADRSLRLHTAERGMWTGITRRDWTACVDRGHDMLGAFGAPFSPPLMVMTRCVSARASGPDAALIDALARTLLQEVVSHPQPSADLRDQLSLTMRELDAADASGGTDYAAVLRSEMARLGIDPATGRFKNR
jgi:hypothetical protein